MAIKKLETAIVLKAHTENFEIGFNKSIIQIQFRRGFDSIHNFLLYKNPRLFSLKNICIPNT